jgi:signal peptidase II
VKTSFKPLFFFFVAATCAGCDQAVKTIAAASFRGTGSITLLGGILRFTYAENPGAFLSLGAGLHPGLRFWLFVVLGAAALAAAMALAFRNKSGWLHLFAAALVIGGGCGNLIDRVSLGFVRDFAQIQLWDFRTGIFNLADAAIMLGCFFLLIRPRWRAGALRRD